MRARMSAVRENRSPRRLRFVASAQRIARNPPPSMPKFVIEREIPGAGKLSHDQLQAISQKSCAVLNQLGPKIQWIESFVTPDKVYCIYLAPNEDVIREHAREGGFPANRVSRVTEVISPVTAEV